MIAKRAREMKPFYVMEILEKAQALEREGHDVIHLEVGEPEARPRYPGEGQGGGLPPG